VDSFFLGRRYNANMDIFVVRHAPAEPRGTGWVDADRPLTLEGIEKWEKAVEGLRTLRVAPAQIFHSPWRRAVETAQRLKPLEPACELVETEHLAATPSRALLGQLQGEAVALVGHEPWMGELVALLLTGERRLGARFPFKKGGVAWLAGDPVPGGCDLRALWTPRSLRAAA